MDDRLLTGRLTHRDQATGCARVFSPRALVPHASSLGEFFLGGISLGRHVVSCAVICAAMIMVLSFGATSAQAQVGFSDGGLANFVAQSSTTPKAVSWRPGQGHNATSGRVWKMVAAAVGVVALITVIAIVVLVIQRRRNAAPAVGVDTPESMAEVTPESYNDRPEALLRDTAVVTGRGEIPITEHVVVLGRSKQNTSPGKQGVVLPLKTVGRRHAHIEFRDNLFWISHLGSVNGTLVNNVLVKDPTVLNNGDVIRIESVDLTFILPAENQSEATQMLGRESADVTNFMGGPGEDPNDGPNDGQSGGMIASLVGDEEYIAPDATEMPSSITVAPGFEVAREIVDATQQQGGLISSYLDDDEQSNLLDEEGDDAPTGVMPDAASPYPAADTAVAAVPEAKRGGLISSYLDDDEQSNLLDEEGDDAPTGVMPDAASSYPAANTDALAVPEAKRGGLISSYLDDDDDPQADVETPLIPNAAEPAAEIDSYYSDAADEYVADSNTSLLNDADFALPEDADDDPAGDEVAAADLPTALAPTSSHDEPTYLLRDDAPGDDAEAQSLVDDFDLSGGSAPLTGQADSSDGADLGFAPALDAGSSDSPAAEETREITGYVFDFELTAGGEGEDTPQSPESLAAGAEQPPLAAVTRVDDVDAPAIAPVMADVDAPTDDEEAAVTSFLHQAFGDSAADETDYDAMAPQMSDEFATRTEDSAPIMLRAPESSDADVMRDVIAPRTSSRRPGSANETDAHKLDAHETGAADSETPSLHGDDRDDLAASPGTAPAQDSIPAQATEMPPATAMAAGRAPVQQEPQQEMPHEPAPVAAEAMRMQPEHAAVQQQPADSEAAAIPEAYLIDLDGATAAQRFQILTDNLSVGRSTPTRTTGREYLSIRRNTIGRRHASVRYAGGRFSVEDHRSINGTFVNGDRVSGSAPLESGDELTFDTFRFNFIVIPSDHVGGGDDDPRLDVDKTQFRGV